MSFVTHFLRIDSPRTIVRANWVLSQFSLLHIYIGIVISLNICGDLEGRIKLSNFFFWVAQYCNFSIDLQRAAVGKVKHRPGWC